MKILWVRPDSIGDNVLAASMLPYIKEKYKAEITVTCRDYITELYKYCPVVDSVISFEEALKSKFDLAINTVYSRTLLSDKLAKTGSHKIAFAGDAQNLLPAEVEEWEKNNSEYTTLIDDHSMPELKKYEKFLRALGIKINAPLKPQIWLPEEINVPKADIVIFAGAQYNYKNYDKLGKAVAPFVKDSDTIMALGDGASWLINERNLVDISNGKKLNLAGQTTLFEAAKILQGARIILGVDTGLAHMANALDKKSTIILGGGHFGRFMPCGIAEHCIYTEMECYGCNWRCNQDKQFKCITDIPIEKIREGIERCIN